MLMNILHFCNIRSGCLALGIAFTLTSLFPLATYSQDSIEEIIVTARKREENLQDIPLTVNAFTEADLDERGITSLQDIADFTPGFDFAEGFGRNDFRPAIRGQSTILGRANAGLFMEGIIIEQGNATVPLSALERVEVVKGPQSALYGRSTLAGAVNYVLKKPGDEFAGEVSAEYGERDHIQVDLHANGPLGEAAGFAITLSHYERDGEYDNFYPGNALGTPAIDNEVGGEETDSITAVLTLSPTDRINLQAHFMYEESDDDQYAIAMLPSRANNCFQITRGGSLMQPLPPQGTPEADAPTVASPAYNGSGYYCGRIDVDDVLEANNGKTSLETSFFGDSGVDTKSIRLGFKADIELSDAMTLTSVTGYNDVEQELWQDQTFGGGDTRLPVVGVGSPFSVQPFSAAPRIWTRVGFLTYEKDDFEDFSQELRLSYDSGNALRYMLGFYYYDSEEKGLAVNSIETMTPIYFDGTPLFLPFNPTFTLADYISTSAFYEGAPLSDDGSEEIESWSVFGMLEFDFTDKLTVGAEFRYNEDDVKSNLEDVDETVERSFNAFLPKFTASYKATDDLLVYANIARGNKPGGHNKQQGVPQSYLEVDESTAWNFELGMKSAWLDNRIMANAAVYHIDWKDMQLTSTLSTTVDGQPRTFSILENVGKSTITGIELDLTAQLTDFWDVRLGYAWTDSEIDEFIQSIAPGESAESAFRESALMFGYADNGDIMISGTQLPQTSKHQLNLSNTLHGNMTGNWSWFLRGDFNYNSKRYAQVYNLAHTGNREIVNLRGGVRGGNFDIEVWVDNVFDNEDSPALIRYVQANNLTFNPFNRAIGVTLPEKRRVGVTARYRF